MSDRTVKVKLEAQVSGFVADMAKAAAAVGRLEAAAERAGRKIDRLGGDSTASLNKVTTAAKKSATEVSASVDKSTRAATLSAKKSSTELVATVGKSRKKLEMLENLLTAARDRQADATGRLRVAEARLSDARSSGQVKASQLQASEEAVAKARRDLVRATDDAGRSARDKSAFEESGSESGRAFGSGFKKWMVGDGQRVFGEGGKGAGTVFGSGFLGVLKTPVLGPAVVATLGAAFVTVMPAIGAVAAGGLITGFGAGLAGLALVFAAQDESVQAAWSKTLSSLGADMSLLSQPFEQTLVDIAGIFGRTVHAFEPALGQTFKSMAPVVTQFVDQVGRALEELVPAVSPIASAFDAVLGSLGPAMQTMLGQISAALIQLADSVRQNPAGLAEMVTGVGALTADLLALIGTLNDVNAAFSELTGGTSLVDATFGILRGSLAPLQGLFASIHTGLDVLNQDWGGLAKWSGEAVLPTKEMTAQLDANSRAVVANAQNTQSGATAAAASAAASASNARELANLGSEYDAVAGNIRDADTALNDLITVMGRAQQKALELAGAQIGFEAAIDAMTESVKDNGRSLDISSEKGRANKQSWLDIANAANAKTEAVLKSTGSDVKAAATAEASKKKFVAQAVQLGFNKQAAERFAKSMFEIPNVTREAKLKANKADLDAKLAAARRQLADPKLTATKRAKLEADIKRLLAQKAAAQRAIDSLHGKNVEINITTRRLEIIARQSTDQGGHPVPANAKGGFYPRGLYPAPVSFAGGKLPEDAMVARGRPGGLVQWAEPETGGEAFIPLAPSKRDRSEKILGQVAATFGMRLEKFALGGFRPGGSLVNLQQLLQQLGLPFNPLEGINFAGTQAAQRRASTDLASSRNQLLTAQRGAQGAAGGVTRAEGSVKGQKKRITDMKAEWRQTDKLTNADNRATRAKLVKRNASQKELRAFDARVAAEKKAKEEARAKALTRANADLERRQKSLALAKNKSAAASKVLSKAEDVYGKKLDIARDANEAHARSVEALLAQQKEAVGFADQISQGLQGPGNVVDLFQQSLSGKGLLADLQGQGADLKKFGGQVGQLRKLGLNENQIQQIIGKGAEAGGEAAQAILDGGKGLVDALNKAQKELEKQADAIGAGAANATYGSKIPARAGGGPVKAGVLYQVNEEGTGQDAEWFRPAVGGDVIPLRKQRSKAVDPNRYARGWSGGGWDGAGSHTMTRIVEQHLHFTGTDYRTADVIGHRTLVAAQRAGKG